jgi:hypothetical protein
MSVNKFTIRQNVGVSKQINIPIQLKWDYLGMDMSIDEYETTMVKEVIGGGRDFEVSRFAHAPSTGTTDDTLINYEFYFYSGGSLNNINNWGINYLNKGFTPQEVYYFQNNFSNSFFKLDFYDSPDEKQQTNYLTIILPTQQGLTMETQMQRTLVNIKKPQFVLDYVGDKEGFFLYWLKKRNFLDINTFYVSAKFYNAKTGQFTQMMTGRGSNPLDLTNGPQANLIGNKYAFDSTQFFYYTVKLDYDTQTYQVFNTYGQRLGTNIPIKWYEYVNPPV